MHAELAKTIIRNIAMAASITFPPIAIALLVHQVLTITVHLHKIGRRNAKLVRKVLQAHGFPIPAQRAFLLTALPVLCLEVVTLRRGIELARRVAGSSLTAEIAEEFLSVWAALRGAYEDALADPRPPVDYVPRKPRERYPGRQRVMVQQGESLSLITLREWDDALLWPLLYDANRSAIGEDHNLIHPGMQLTLPSIAHLSQAEIESVRQRGRDWT
jgi:hypothetical protein